MCLYPKRALINYYEADDGELLQKMIFCSSEEKRQFLIEQFENLVSVDLPCGKCVECLKQKSTEWSYRIMLEASQYDKVCFITLTYRDNPVTLVKKDLQNFIKRLRKFVCPLKIRYFACGEYGSKHKRPHYHVIIFGWRPDDMVCYNRTDRLYGSQILEKIWNKGFVSVGNVELDSAKYCAKYMQKLQDLPDNLVKPFVIMSLKPGIGLTAFLHKKQKYLPTDKVYFEGKYIKIPKYYLDVLKKKACDLQQIESNRLMRLKKCDIMKKTDEELVLLRKKKESFLK